MQFFGTNAVMLVLDRSELHISQQVASFWFLLFVVIIMIIPLLTVGSIKAQRLVGPGK